MFSFLPSPLKGAVSFLIYLINTILLTVPLILISLLKFIVPFQRVVVILDRILMGIAGLWIYINSVNTDLFCQIDWDIRGLDKLNPGQWYLVLSNHQSWVDILVLQKTLRKKIPMLKFFLKKELIWVPFLGLAWWALDFPFMKRYSREFLAKNPHMKGKDLESTRKACQKFKHTPVSIMNFVEGTRYTPEKAKTSAFSHLLTPKAGGIAFVLGSMDQCLNHILDVTIVYPDRVPTFWSFISGKTRKIIVDCQLLEIGWQIKGDYFNDPVFKAQFCEWLNQLWQGKDRKIEHLLSS